MNDDYTFRLLMRVRYCECDAQQVVFNGRYADYADIAATEFIRVAAGGFQTLLEQGIDNQVVSLKIDWQSSAKFDDVLALDVNVGHIGNTSYSLCTNIFDYSTGRPVATITVVYVVVDTEQYQKMAIPNSLKQKLNTPLNRVLCDQAGR